MILQSLVFTVCSFFNFSYKPIVQSLLINQSNKSICFIISVMVLVNHYLAFQYFATVYYSFTEVRLNSVLKIHLRRTSVSCQLYTHQFSGPIFENLQASSCKISLLCNDFPDFQKSAQFLLEICFDFLICFVLTGKFGVSKAGFS